MSLSTKIREEAAKEQAKSLVREALQEQRRRMMTLVDKPAAGKSRLKAHAGEAHNKKLATRAKERAARRSRSRNRR